MKRISLIVLIALLFIMSLFLTGYVDKCRQEAEKVDQKIAEEKAKESKSAESVIINQNKPSTSESVENDSKTDESNQVSEQEDMQSLLEWPEGWPLEKNDNIVLEVSNTKRGDDYTSWDIIGKYPGSAEEIYNYYKGKSGKFTISADEAFDKGSNIKSYQLQINNDKLKAVLVFEDTSDSQAAVSIYVEVSD